MTKDHDHQLDEATVKNSGLHIIGEKVALAGMLFWGILVMYLFWTLVDELLIGIGLGSIFISIALIYLFRSFQPNEIGFDRKGFVVTYPMSKKRVEYDDIVITRQTGGPENGKLFVQLKNGDEVFLWFLSKDLYAEVIRRVCGARPDLLKTTTLEDLLWSLQWTLEDTEHVREGETFWRERWRDSLAYKYHAWGRRPKRR